MNGNRQIAKPLSSPRSAGGAGANLFGQQTLLTEGTFLGGTKILLERMHGGAHSSNNQPPK
jgi:hypothetical protein